MDSAGDVDERALYHDCSFVNLYDELTMPSEIRKVIDLVIIQAYGFDTKMAESGTMAELISTYR